MKEKTRINTIMNLYDLILCTNHILFESFKSDLIDTYNKNGLQVDGNQKLLSAVQIFNSNNLIKDKVKKDLKNPPNIAQALVKSFPNPQDLVDYINNVQQSFVEKDQQNKEKKQRKEQAEKASGDFYVYPCHTFEEAHSAAFSHIGSLERLSNGEIKKKYKIKVPEPASHYNTTKSPAEFLEYMKNAPFFMSPSWCVTANKDHWNAYQLSTAKDATPKCYIIISKAYPNLRFCIVFENKDLHIDKMTDESMTISNKLEIKELRDPWQIGGGSDCIEIGKEMLDLAFNKSKAIEDVITKATKKVTIVKRFKDITDSSNNISFEKNESLTSFNASLPNLKDGRRMFRQSKNLTSFKGGLPKLENGEGMFCYCKKLVSFNSNLPSLEDGEDMFSDCYSLAQFDVDMPNLKKGRGMFEFCDKLASFNANLSNLEDGRDMFMNCKTLASFDVDMPNLKNGQGMFMHCHSLTSFRGDLSSLEDGNLMFIECNSLTSFRGDLSSLKIGTDMFERCQSLTSFRGDLSSLEYGKGMFLDCTNLTSFHSNLSSLIKGDKMFAGCNNLTSFHSNLSSLQTGENMFRGCRLDKESVINIANTLPTLQNRRRIDIGIDASLKNDEDVRKAIQTIEEKNWITQGIYS